MLSNGIAHLEWDSDFFGITVGRIKVDGQCSAEELEDLTSNFDLVYLFSKQEQQHLKAEELLDIKINSVLDYSFQKLEVCPEISKITSPRHQNELKELLVMNGLNSRFYLDEKLRPKYEELYIKWGERCFNVETHNTWFYEEEGKLLGFITLSQQEEPQVELCAVFPEYRSKGIARKLWMHAFESMSKEASMRFRISFQGKNTIAKKFYESLGFVEEERWFVYHLWA